MKKITIAVLFEIGDIVYLRNNSAMTGIVTGLSLRPNNCIVYYVTWQDTCERTHFGIELSSEKIPDYSSI